MTETEDRRPGWRARIARKRYAQNRRALELSGAGWLPIPPELAETARALLDQAGVELPALETSNPR